MKQHGKIIFSSRIPLIVWVMPLIAGGAAFGQAWADRNWSAAATVPAITVVVMVAVMWGACEVAGRRRLAEVRLVGSSLICRQMNVFNRGKVFAVPLEDVGGWKRRIEYYKSQPFQTVSFEAYGRTYDLPLYGTRHLDMEALDQLIAGQL